MDIKNIGHPYNLGRATKWSDDDREWLIDHGAFVNKQGYLHIPLDKIEGTVPLGRTDKSTPDLRVFGRRLSIGKRPKLL